jgi:hypothetical protein
MPCPRPTVQDGAQKLWVELYMQLSTTAVETSAAGAVSNNLSRPAGDTFLSDNQCPKCQRVMGSVRSSLWHTATPCQRLLLRPYWLVRPENPRMQPQLLSTSHSSSQHATTQNRHWLRWPITARQNRQCCHGQSWQPPRADKRDTE